MSMTLSPAMSPAGLNFREYNSCFSPANQQSASAKQTAPNTFHATGGNHRGKTTA